MKEGVKTVFAIAIAVFAAVIFIVAFLFAWSETVAAEKNSQTGTVIIETCYPGVKVGFVKFNDSMTDFKILKEKRINAPNKPGIYKFSVFLEPGKYGVTLRYKLKKRVVLDFQEVEIKSGEEKIIDFCPY